MKKIIAILLVFTMCFAFAGCFEETDEVQNIKIYSSVLASYESTINITSEEPLDGGERAVFKPEITEKDITVSGALNGKKVKSVKFIDQYNIEVVFEGKSTEMENSHGFGKITISKNALENETDSFGYVTVEKAYIASESATYSSATGTYTACYRLAAGSFTELAEQCIRIADGYDGTIEEITLENGKLTVKITGASNEPKIVIGAEATSFNKEVTVSVSTAVREILE